LKDIRVGLEFYLRMNLKATILFIKRKKYLINFLLKKEQQCLLVSFQN